MDSSDLTAVVTRYLDALQRFDLEAAADCFTGDLFYSHPPYSSHDNGGLRHEVHGRPALLELFRQRGPSQVTHEVTAAALDGAQGFVAGTFTSGGQAGSFVSTVQLAPDGRIASYAAYASAPPVGATVGPGEAVGVG